MKNNTKVELKLRTHSIRNLTAAELRVANGGHGKDGGCTVVTGTQPATGTAHTSGGPKTHK